jgi:hypothetical protein
MGTGTKQGITQHATSKPAAASKRNQEALKYLDL